MRIQMLAKEWEMYEKSEFETKVIDLQKFINLGIIDDLKQPKWHPVDIVSSYVEIAIPV